MKSSGGDERLWRAVNPVFYGVLSSAEFFDPTGTKWFGRNDSVNAELRQANSTPVHVLSTAVDVMCPVIVAGSGLYLNSGIIIIVQIQIYLPRPI